MGKLHGPKWAPSKRTNFAGTKLSYWQAHTRLTKLTAEIKSFKKAANRTFDEDKADELQEAWRKRDNHSVWVVSRQMAKKRLGPRKRNYAQPIQHRPHRQDWLEHLGQDGGQGGYNAKEISFEDFFEETQKIAKDEEMPNLGFDTFELAKADLSDLRTGIKTASLRKAFPPLGDAC